MGEVVLLGVMGFALSAITFLARARRRDPGARPGRPASWVARALLPLLALAVAAGALSPWMGWPPALRPVLLLWLSTLAWLPLTRRWSAPAHASWALGASLGGAYLVAMTWWTVRSGLTGATLVAAWFLLLLEVGVVAVFLAHSYEVHDTLGSQRWDRRRARLAAPPTPAEGPAFVSIHVPTRNEPPDVVVETLERLRRLDHPAYEVLVVDNNTEDAALWAPVEELCARHPEILRFHRLVDWPGFRSGALNHALAQTDSRASLIGVVDADDHIDRDWLAAAVAPFADPEVGFVQDPPDHRGWEQVPYLRALHRSVVDDVAVAQPSRDERNVAILGSTRGLIRREALAGVGGWDEGCVSEDAGLSLRLHAAGWAGMHLDRPHGRGVLPLTFEALKRQRFRWGFGRMQLLWRHRRLLLGPGRLTAGQRLGHLGSGLQGFGDLLGLIVSLAAMAALVDLAVGEGLVVRRLAGLLVVAVPALVVLAVGRALAGARAAPRQAGESPATWRDTVEALVLRLSLGWIGSVATVSGLVERQWAPLRTIEVRPAVRWVDALRANVVEVTLLVLAVGCALLGLVFGEWPEALGLTILLAVPAIGWAAAPRHTVAALRADLPPDLGVQRAMEARRGWAFPTGPTPWATLAGVAVVAALVLVVVQPGSSAEPTRPVWGRVSDPTPSPTPTSTTTGSTPTPTPSSTTTSPSPTPSPTPTATPTSPPATAPPATTVPPASTPRPTRTPKPKKTRTPKPTPTATGRR